MKTGSCGWILIAAGAAVLCSCTHVSRERSAVPLVLPEHYARAEAGAAYPDRWWTSFGDERLNELVSEALSGSFSLRQAKHRLEQAQAAARKAGAQLIPQVNIEGSAARSRTAMTDATGKQVTQTANRFGLNLAASYEIDLWGRVGATRRAAVLDAQAARDGFETAAMTLAAQITDTWYQLAAYHERLELLRKQIKNKSDHVRLVALRFDTGQLVAPEVWQQREQLAALRALPPRLEAALAATRHQLAVLLGRSPQETEDLVPPAWPELPSLPETGVPADLLEKRPDIRAVLKGVRAADERVAAALADRLPALRLTASTGYSAAETGDLFKDLLWNVAGNLLAPIIDGGRRQAEVARSRAAAGESLARCAEALLNAMREVEDALINEQTQNEIIDRQAEQLELARRTLQQTRSRHRRGLIDYLGVLSALEREQSLDRGLVDARRQLISYRIQLHRSLGGNWTASILENTQ